MHLLIRFLLFFAVLMSLAGCRVINLQRRMIVRKMNRNGLQSRELNRNGFQLNYWIGGQGPTVLFLHGFGGDALSTWQNELLLMSKSHTVIAPDLLWFGKSSYSGEANLTSQRKAIELLVDELGIEKLTIVGQSYGGFVTLDFANHHPEKISKLIFANCPGHTFDAQHLDTVCKRFNVSQIDELFVFEEPSQLQRLYDLAAHKSIQIPKQLLEQSYALYFSAFHKEKKALMRTLRDEQGHFDFSIRPSIPCFVVWSELDELFNQQSGQQFAQKINANLHILKGCGHAPQLDNRPLFTSKISELLNLKIGIEM
jgi:pimeloyl-ACP methyl ester carboxylesterase